VGLEDELVRDAESTVRRSEISGGHLHYLTYNTTPTGKALTRHGETYVIPIRLPREATNIVLHGPGHFTRRGSGTTYGVRITFTELGSDVQHHRTIELPHPALDVQLLDREPTEAFKKVA
jgi:hypothetical protein